MTRTAQELHREGLAVVGVVTMQRLGRPLLTSLAGVRSHESSGPQRPFRRIVRERLLGIPRAEGIDIRPLVARAPALEVRIRRAVLRILNMVRAGVHGAEARAGAILPPPRRHTRRLDVEAPTAPRSLAHARDHYRHRRTVLQWNRLPPVATPPRASIPTGNPRSFVYWMLCKLTRTGVSPLEIRALFAVYGTG